MEESALFVIQPATRNYQQVITVEVYEILKCLFQQKNSV